jgi:hypothetical protein
MDLLFKREQTPGRLNRVNFKLWGKIELNRDEENIVQRYQFDEAVLIAVLQPFLIRTAIIIGLIVAGLLLVPLAKPFGEGMAILLALSAGGGAGYWYYNEKRETIYVRDLLHGRDFSCDSVVELARKEAWLETVVSYLRQVMESAKHWDGTQRHHIDPLPKDEARQVILKGL